MLVVVVRSSPVIDLVCVLCYAFHSLSAHHGCWGFFFAAVLPSATPWRSRTRRDSVRNRTARVAARATPPQPSPARPLHGSLMDSTGMSRMLVAKIREGKSDRRHCAAPRVGWWSTLLCHHLGQFVIQLGPFRRWGQMVGQDLLSDAQQLFIDLGQVQQERVSFETSHQLT